MCKYLFSFLLAVVEKPKMTVEDYAALREKLRLEKLAKKEEMKKKWEDEKQRRKEEREKVLWIITTLEVSKLLFKWKVSLFWAFIGLYGNNLSMLPLDLIAGKRKEERRETAERSTSKRMEQAQRRYGMWWFEGKHVLKKVVLQTAKLFLVKNRTWFVDHQSSRNTLYYVCI